MARHNFTFALPFDYSLPSLPTPLGKMIVTVVVRLFISTQNRLVTLHSALIKAHEETVNSPRSVIYRPLGSTMQLVTKTESPQFLP
jgi:hypothetical protein